MFMKKFTDKVNEELSLGSNNEYIIDITVNELIEKLSKYDGDSKLSFAYNGEGGFIGLNRSGEILTEIRSGKYILNLVYY